MSLEQQYPEIALKKAISTKKRQLARQIRETRDKVNQNNSIHNEFAYDLLFMFCRNELANVITVLLLIFLITLTCLFWAPQNQILLWLGAILITKGLLISVCRKFCTLPKDKIKIAEWRHKIVFIELLYGLTWASIALVEMRPEHYPSQFLIFGTILIILVMRMMVASTVPTIAYSGTIPIMLALVYKFMTLEDNYNWIIAAMTAGMYCYFILLIKGLNENILTMLSYRAEKDYLISEIAEAKAFSDESRRRAEEANIAKSRFLATMSHELRTPLNAILGFSEVMKDELFGSHNDKRYKEYSNDIHNSGQHLLNLINEVLDLSRIEAGRYDMNEETLRLSDISRECCRLLQLKADKKDIEIIEEYNDLDIKLWADERAIRQVILNLLSNAIKFTPNGGTILVTIHQNDDKKLQISIKDNGPGIPEDEIPIILTNFGQGSLAHETAEGGSGLGLPIVKGLIEIHDGTFEIKSELRKGTEVIAYFPTQRISQVLPQLPIQDVDNSNSRRRHVHHITTKTNGHGL